MEDSTSIAGVLAVTACIGGATFASYKIQTHLVEATITLESKERLMSVSSADGNTSTDFKNFVYTADEVYGVRDSFWNWHFRAMTVYASLPDSGECDVILSGYRWGYLSTTQNIISATCAPR